MSRLIDADWVLAHLWTYEPSDEEWSVTGGTALRLIHKAIDNAPTVDANVVGRCRDCAKYHAEIAWCDEWSCFEKDGEPCDPADSMQWREIEPDEYCSRFRGKENNV